MSKWPGWVKLQPAQGEDILRAIVEDFAPIIPRAGRVLNGIMSQRLPFLSPQIDNVAELGEHKNDRLFLAIYSMRRVRLLLLIALCVKKKREKEAQQAALPISTVVVNYEQRGLGRFLAADVKAQLKLRHVPFKHNDKLGVLEELWKVCDASHTNLSNAIAAGGVAGGGNSGVVGSGGAAAAAAAAPAAAAPVAAAPVAAAPVAAAPVAAAPVAAAPVAADAAAAQRKCAICNQYGHRSDNKKFHPTVSIN